MQQTFPPFELRADPATLDGLRAGLTGFAFGGRTGQTWLRGDGGQIWAVTVNQRDLQFKFEVFALAIDTTQALRARIAAWKPPSLSDDVPEIVRRLMSVRPVAPTPTTEFEPWPFGVWRTDVLRRVEFIIEDVDVGPTFGSAPNSQDAARPGEIPQVASAACEVAAGLLFTGDNGQRLLVGVDWMPFNLVFTHDAAEIDQYIASCEAIEIAEYSQRFSAPI
ncbi:MAG: hypothetical protein ABI906_07620 [Pseudomonadota bacterium]